MLNYIINWYSTEYYCKDLKFYIIHGRGNNERKYYLVLNFGLNCLGM